MDFEHGDFGASFLFWLANNWILIPQPKEQSHEDEYEDDFDRYGEIVTIRKQFKQFGVNVEDPELKPLRDKLFPPGEHTGKMVSVTKMLAQEQS